jgi:hypothetical protein
MFIQKFIIPALTAFLLFLPLKASAAVTAAEAEKIVQQHLDAQNAHNVEAMLVMLSDMVDFRVLSNSEGGDVKKILNKDDQLRQFETALSQNPNSHFRVISKISTPTTVIVNEVGSNFADGKSGAGITLYHVEGNKISGIWMLDTGTDSGN